MSTVEKGTAFENQVLDLLRLLPGCHAQDHVRLAGKDIDALCRIDDPLGGTSTVAFECKDYERPLSRETVASILADYQPLLTKNEIDRFCLVTRNGIVANAKSCLDGKTTQHLTFSELLDLLLAPRNLVNNMLRRFELDSLDKYYVPARCYAVDLPWVSANFHAVYNSFIDLALQVVRDPDVSPHDYERAKTVFANYARGSTSNVHASYDEFQPAIAARISNATVDLESLVISWADDATISQGLALLGSYGTGKSSFAKRLAHVWAGRYQRGETTRIPFLIELRDFGSHQDIDGLITHELVNRHAARHGSYETFQLLNREGKFLLILDGFDEMKQGMSKDALLFNFNELNKLHSGKSKVLLCGRPTVFASEAEQTLVLAGHSDACFTNQAEYIQVRLTTFSDSAVIQFLSEYAKALGPKEKDKKRRISTLINDLKTELPRNPDLSTLLSRPVHLPMLMAVLPDWQGHITELRRSTLYSMFVQRTIAREMWKRRTELQPFFGVEIRRRFAAELATQMFRLGESRSIKYSEIPDDLVLPFKQPTQTLDAVRRDLVAACFLDRKPPDILFFGHKSFAEYLTAERVVSAMGTAPFVTADIGIRLTPEVLSFVIELAQADHWRAVAQNVAKNVRLLSSSIDALTRNTAWNGVPPTDRGVSIDFSTLSSTLISEPVVSTWIRSIVDVPPMILRRLVEYLELVAPKSLPEHCERLLAIALEASDDAIAIHAFRALCATGATSEKKLLRQVGPLRTRVWWDAGWFRQNAKQEIAAAHLLGIELKEAKPAQPGIAPDGWARPTRG